MFDKFQNICIIRTSVQEIFSDKSNAVYPEYKKLQSPKSDLACLLWSLTLCIRFK